MPTLTRDGHSIHYETLGDPASPPLLLIMGLALSSRAWDRLPERLSDRFYVIVFDNRGTGRSARRGRAYRMRDLADDATAVVEALGLPSANVFGISMGGMVAQELALRHPERVRSLALGCTFASWRRSRKPKLRTMLELMLLHLGVVSPEGISRIVVSPGWDQQNPGAAVEWIKRAERTALRFAFAQMLAIARHGTTERLRKLRVPTLILTGDQDRLVPMSNSEELARAIPGAKLQVLRGAGHAFPLEQEVETISALASHFLAAAEPAAIPRAG